MKTIGLIGGMSWQSTVTYYRLLNKAVNKELGGFHSARCILFSVDFDEIEHLQQQGEWEAMGKILGDAAYKLEGAGADCIVVCTNTMHKVAPAIQQRVRVPLLHIADAVADLLIQQSIQTVGLLGTRYTMEQDFYITRLRERGLEVLVPGQEGRDEMNRIIFEELVQGKIVPESKQRVLEIMEDLGLEGAEGVILGCTEIGLLVHSADTELPLFDSTVIHSERAARFALGK